jgi:hypothetical protein
MRLIVCSTSATGLGASVAWRSWKRRVRHGSISPGGSRWLPVGYVAGFRRELGACERSSQDQGVDDRDLPGAFQKRQAVAGQHHGASLVRRRDTESRPPVRRVNGHLYLPNSGPHWKRTPPEI